MISKIFAPLVCYVFIQKTMKSRNLLLAICSSLLSLIGMVVLTFLINSDRHSYYYTIITPDRGTWYTTNTVWIQSYYVSFTQDNQEIKVSEPFTLIKETYAPTNFIADDE